jgi:hypothetical protein
MIPELRTGHQTQQGSMDFEHRGLQITDAEAIASMISESLSLMTIGMSTSYSTRRSTELVDGSLLSKNSMRSIHIAGQNIEQYLPFLSELLRNRIVRWNVFFWRNWVEFVNNRSYHYFWNL